MNVQVKPVESVSIFAHVALFHFCFIFLDFKPLQSFFSQQFELKLDLLLLNCTNKLEPLTFFVFLCWFAIS